jgi:hypothetical protein
MKKIYLTILFTNYILFMPFVMVNCSLLHPDDAPYDKLTQNADNDAAAAADDPLADCQNMDYLTADCVTVMQDESDRIATEKATVAVAAKETTDLVQCPSVMEEDVIAAEAAAAAAETAAADTTTTDTTTTDATATETETTPTVTTPTIDCATTLSDTVAAQVICEADAADDYHDNCKIVDDTLNTMLFDCDALIEQTYIYSEDTCADATPTDSLEFCAALAANFYDLCHPAADATLAQGFSCPVLDHIYNAVLCECKKDEPAISDSVCTSVTDKQTASEQNIQSTD